MPGFSGDLARPPLIQGGFAPIAHAGFELGLFDASPTAHQVVAPTASSGSGHARISLRASGDAFDLTLSFQNLIGINTQNLIRGPAPRGVNAPGVALYTLAGSGTATGSVDASDLPITPEVRTQLEAGLLYIEVQTDAFPEGEIRGEFDDVLFGDGFESF